MKRICIIIIIIFPLLFQNNILHAQSYLIEADGSYIFGDGPEEDINTAKKRAKIEAMRNATEKVGIYIESYTHTINNQITKDEVRTISGALLKIESCEIKTEVIENIIVFKCHIKAWVDNSNIDLNALLQNKELIIKTTEQQKKINELNDEMYKLKQQFKDAKHSSEKEELQKKISLNEKKLEATLINISEYSTEEFISAIKDFAQRNNKNLMLSEIIHTNNDNAFFDSDTIMIGSNAKEGCILTLYTHKDGMVFKATLCSLSNSWPAKLKTYETEAIILNILGIYGDRLNYFMNDIRTRDIPFGVAVWSYLANKNIVVEHTELPAFKNIFFVRITAYNRLFPPERID